MANPCEVSTLDELRAALAAGEIPIVVGDIWLTTTGREAPTIILTAKGRLHVVAWGSSQPHVEAWESSQPHVEARESSQPHVEARESSQPHVVAWGSSQPHVVAWESSQPYVEAKGTVQLSVCGQVAVVAAAAVAICVLGGSPKIEGGGFVTRVDRSTPQAWCDYYGVEVEGGYALLYKAVNGELCSDRGFSYPVGSTPEAPDWDDGKEECGGGLHFSPCPSMARTFFPAATRFLACPLRLEEMAVHPDGQYLEKCKAKRVALPCWEVDIHGRPVAGAVVSWPPAAPRSQPTSKSVIAAGPSEGAPG